MNQFFTLETQNIVASKKEVIRYLGYRALHQPDEIIDRLIDLSILELKEKLRPGLVWDEFSCKVCSDGKTVLLGYDGKQIFSEKLAQNLSGCTSVVMFAATIGSEVDKHIRLTNYTDAAKACVLQATGAMYIEEYVNAFNEYIDKKEKEAGNETVMRYSPGYGDLALENQKLFFSLLNCSKIGLTLMNTLIMAPEKSVTAFIGIKNNFGVIL